MHVCIFGLGEAGTCYAGDLLAAGVDVHAFDPNDVDTPDGVVRHDSPGEAVEGAVVVMALTAAVDAPGALAQAIDAIPRAAVYADCATASPGLKQSLAAVAGDAGIAFVDVALMSPVPGRGIRTPTLASGPGAARFVEVMTPLGMDVTVGGPEPGTAAARKLLRSVAMKGFAALLIESIDAARAAGLDHETWENLVDQFTEADESLMRRLVEGTGPHSRRRLHEMEAAATMLAELGVDPVMTRATVESLRRIDAGETPLPDLP